MDEPVVFLNMFPDYEPPEALRSALSQAVLVAADIEPSIRKVTVQIHSDTYIPQRFIREASSGISAVYGLQGVEIFATYPAEQLSAIEQDELTQLFVEEDSMARGSLAGAKYQWDASQLNIQLSANGRDGLLKCVPAVCRKLKEKFSTDVTIEITAGLNLTGQALFDAMEQMRETALDVLPKATAEPKKEVQQQESAAFYGKAFKGNVILERILAGETCALVSDAGSPAISDPGEELVKQCAEAGVTVCAIPGPCAVITALSISGQSTGRFCFEGFLSTAKKSRREHLESLISEQRTMVFYEAPHKLLSTLEDMAETFGPDRPISLCRELTKLHEEVVRTTLGEAITKYTETPPKGEFVLVLAGAPATVKEEASASDAAARVAQLMEEGLSRKDAVKQTAKELDLPKNIVYDAALHL